MTGRAILHALRASVVALGLILGLLGAGSTHAAENVTVAAGQHPGFGRIAFRWPAPVGFETEASGTALTIRFERPLAGRLDRVTSELDGYVKAASLTEDGKAVHLELTRPFKLRSFKDTPAVVVIDLLTASPKAVRESESGATQAAVPAQAKAPTAAARAATAQPEGPRVEVRRGEHKGFERLVFDWPKAVGYRIAREADHVTIQFDRPARIELGAVRRRPLRYASELETRAASTGAAVSLRLAEGAQLRDFRDGPRVGLDLVETAAGAEAAANKIPDGKLAKNHAPGSKAAPLRPAEPPAAAAGAGKATSEQAAAPAAAPVFVKAGPATAQAATGAPTPLIKGRSDKATGASATPAGRIATAATDGAPADALAVGYAPTEQGAALSFPWTDTVALASFRRADHLWLVFDRPAALDLSKLPPRGDGESFAEAQQLPHLRGTVLRLRVPQGVGASLRKENFTWTVELNRLADRPRVPIAIRPEPNSPIGPRVNLPIDGPAYPVEVTDPDAGDKLTVVPVNQPGWGIFLDRSYVEFRLLGTAQGIVVEPKVDGIVVTSRKEGVDILGEKNLTLSAAPEAPSAGAAFGNAETTPALFDLAVWRGGLRQTPVERRQALQLKLAHASAKHRNRVRLELARFYFAEGMATEAISLIDLIAREEPELLDTPETLVMRGALATLARDDKAAAKFLGDDRLRTVPEAALWRGALAAGERDYARAESELLLGGALIAHYPRPVQVELGLLAAETLLAQGDKERVKTLIDGLGSLDLGDTERGRIAYLRGRQMELEDRPADALPLFEEAAKSEDALGAARATLARVELLEKLGKLDRKEAIKHLDGLRYAWRGDAFELDLLDRLGRLYLADHDYRAALITLRHAVTYFPTDPRAKALTELLSSTFADLFSKGGADKLPPLMAVAIYDEFTELTPVGPAADEVALHLVDRLVAVDLLDRAAKTLETLVKNRLAGAEKALAGSRLAKVYLLDEKPAKALEALKESGMDGLPQDQAGERRDLEARALLRLGQPADAIARLDGDAGLEAERIRAEANWKAEKWPDAAKSYERLAQGLPHGSALLDPAQSNLVLRWAVSLTMLGDRAAADALRARFEAAMPQGPAHDTFAVVTSGTGEPGEGFRKLAASVAQVDQFKAFMTDYRKEFLDRAKSGAAEGKSNKVATN